MSSLVPLSLCFHKHHSHPNFQPPILCPLRAPQPSPSVFSSCYNGHSSSKDLSTTGKTESPFVVSLSALSKVSSNHSVKNRGGLSISPVLYRVWLLALVWIVWFNKRQQQWILFFLLRLQKTFGVVNVFCN